ALKENHRLRESVDVAKRRALAIALLFLRKGADQPVQISRLEFVRVACERRGVAHAIVTGPALKKVTEHQRGERRVAAGAAAGDDAPILVNRALPDQEFRAVDTVVDVDDTPVAVQSLPIGAAEAGAAAVIDIEHRDPAARPELGAEVERA